MTTVRLLCLAMITAMAVGCKDYGPDLSPMPILETSATATPLAVEQQATPKSGNYYQPPGWNGAADVDCKDFDTHAHAMSFFRGTGGTTGNDPYGMDGDHDGNACETLP